MKIFFRRYIPILLFIILSSAIVLPVSAEDTEYQVIPVEQWTNYMCGNTFEISFPDVISTGSMFTNAGTIQATAEKDKTLLQIRIQLRNMTSSIFSGITTESFKLTGYVRDRSISYYPEIILNTDYFGSGNYYAWDQLPPLRLADILLIFRVNPILINWELTFDPEFTGSPSYQLGRITYEPSKTEPCSGLFQFPVMRNLETNVLTTYER